MIQHNKSRIAAAHDDPWIGVHVLTEFIFCERAGHLAMAEHTIDELQKRPNLRYLPRWSAISMREALVRASVLSAISGILLATVVTCLLLRWQTWPMIANVLLGTAAWICWQVLRHGLRAMWILRSRLRATDLAGPIDPARLADGCVGVSWWSLLNSGFESVAYKDSLRDERLRLNGRPWRVLRKGSLRIPVFLASGQSRLHRQHHARIAAYCHLLETCEGAKSPFGVVLFGDSYEGETVPNQPSSRKAFHNALVAARASVRAARRGHLARRPSNANRCSGCPFGKPYVSKSFWLVSRARGIHAVRGADGRRYHSTCGDQYRWVPPHEKAIQKRLI